MDLRGYVRAIRRGWWLVVAGALIGAGIAAALVATATPIYAAKVTFYVSTPLLSDNNSLQSTDQFAQDRANSYANLLSSERLASMVVKTAGLNMAPRQVAGKISGSAQLDTVMVTGIIHDASPGRALRIAQAVAEDMPKLVEQLDKSAGTSSQSPVTLHVVSGPSVGAAPISPRKKLDIGFGLGVGLIIGLGVAVLRELLDTAVRSVDDLSETTGRPVIGEIGFDAAARKTPLIVDEAHAARRSEDFRQLRTNLQFLDAAEPLHVIVVTSALEGEGKSTTAANLGVVMAEAGMRVALIEADLRRPKLSSYLGLERASGLTSVLSGQAQVADVLQPWGSEGLQVLASGPLPPNPSELLGSPRMAELLTAMREHFDVIIIDAPPLLPVTDAAVLSTHGAGVVLVVRHGKTKHAQLRAALATLDTVNARILGAVLSMRPTKGVDGGYYGAYYPSSEPVVALDADSPDDEEAGRTPVPTLTDTSHNASREHSGEGDAHGRRWRNWERRHANVPSPQRLREDSRAPRDAPQAEHMARESLEPAKGSADRT